MVCQNKIIGPATESLSDVCHKIYRGHGPSERRASAPPGVHRSLGHMAEVLVTFAPTLCSYQRSTSTKWKCSPKVP